MSTAQTSHRIRVVDVGTVDTDDLTWVRQIRPRVPVANGYQPVGADLNEYGEWAIISEKVRENNHMIAKEKDESLKRRSKRTWSTKNDS